MTNPYRNINELREWLKANSSGVYRPAAHAATVIEEQESEITTLRDENDRLRAKLEAMESQEPTYAFRRRGLEPFLTCSFERYAELSQNDQFETKVLLEAPVADKSARITEQDAREAARSYAFYCMSEARGDAGTLADWIGSPEGLALLNKLNADRQVPAVEVPDYENIIRDLAQEFKEAWPDDNGKYAWLIGYSDEFKAAPSPSHQNAETDAERFCDSHCTWRDHHPDCPSHESEGE